VEGIGRLARQGNKHAFDALFDFLSIPSLSIRRAAVQAILARGQRLRKKVAERLPPEQRYLLNIKPKKVSQVPQIDHPERNLRRRQPLDSSKPTPPVLPEDAPRRSAPSPDTKQGE
jgi:hypothetical protein